MASTVRPGEARTAVPAYPVIVALGPLAGSGKTYRVESPGRLMRIYAMLSEASEEIRSPGLPPGSLAWAQQLLEAACAEIERAVSPALTAELHQLCGSWVADPGATEVRIEYAGLLGWLSGLVVAMVTELEAATTMPMREGMP